MYDLDTKHQFIELRAKGMSLARISVRLKVSRRTLIEWCKKDRESIRAMRAVELEALQEKILDSRETQLRMLQNNLTRIEEAIGEVAEKTAPFLHHFCTTQAGRPWSVVSSPWSIVSSPLLL